MKEIHLRLKKQSNTCYLYIKEKAWQRNGLFLQKRENRTYCQEKGGKKNVIHKISYNAFFSFWWNQGFISANSSFHIKETSFLFLFSFLFLKRFKKMSEWSELVSCFLLQFFSLEPFISNPLSFYNMPFKKHQFRLPQD